MKTTTETYLTLFAAFLWLFMIGCYLADKETPKDIDTVTWFPNHSEIPKDKDTTVVINGDTIVLHPYFESTDTTNWLIEPRFIDN